MGSSPIPLGCEGALTPIIYSIKVALCGSGTDPRLLGEGQILRLVVMCVIGRGLVLREGSFFIGGV